MGIPAELEHELRHVVRCGTAEQRQVRRAQVILLTVVEGLGVSETARRCGSSRPTVRKWKQRFMAEPGLAALRDAQRSGRPRTRTERDDAVVISLGCSEPESHGRLEARMTQSLIAELAVLQGTTLSRSTVQRVLATAEVQPHRERYYLFTPKDRPDYVARRDAICDLYMADLPDDEVVVCFDEKTNIQALGAPYPGRSTAPGQVRRKEHNYIRHGTRNLVAAVRPDSGEVLTAELFPSRGFATPEAIAMLRSIAMLLPWVRVIHLVWDNGSTHISKAMKAFLASEDGKKFRVYYTPAHASWLNLAENFFSRFTRRYLAGRRYSGLDDLDAHVYAALEDYNARNARPMSWTYNPRKVA